MNRTFKYKSSSSDETYTVTVGANGYAHCTCRGFKSPSSCWHVVDATERCGIPTVARSNTTPKPHLYIGEEGEGRPAWASSPTGRLTKTEPEFQWPVRTTPEEDYGLDYVKGDVVRSVPEKNGGLFITVDTAPIEERIIAAFTSSVIPKSMFVEPMLGRALKEGESIQQWVGKPGFSLEIKYDGHRVIVWVDENRIAKFWSRDFTEINDRVGRHIINFFRDAAPGVYDGELFIPGKSSTDVPAKKYYHKQKLVLFDMLSVYAPQDEGRTDENGYRSTLHLPLSSRRMLLQMALSEVTKGDIFQSPVHEVSEQALNDVWAKGGEGVMVKKDDESYQPGCRRWIKFKKELVGRMKVTGYKAGKLGPHAVVIGVDLENFAVVQAKTLDTKMRTAFDTNPDAYIGKTLVYFYQQRTASGKARHPRCDHFED